MSDFQAVFFAAPPIARTMTLVTVLLSWAGYFGFYNLLYMLFFSDYVFTIKAWPQVWRVVTNFFISGGNIGLILDPFFLYHYTSQLETGSPRFSRPGSLVVYLLFVNTIILFLGGVYLGGPMLLHSMTMAMTYTWAQEDPNQSTNFFVVNMARKYVPYASLVVTLAVAGPHQMLIQATGIPAAHCYEFFDRIWPELGNGPKLIHTPAFIENYFRPPQNQGNRRDYGRAFAPQRGGPGQAASGNASASAGRSTGSSWTSGAAWNTRGSGRRLGGD